MPPWIPQIVAFQKKESKLNSSRWVQLATIGLDNSPRVRTVVFRGWTEFFEMILLIDKRSQKYFELKSNNNVEICWLFKKSKCQFRFRGLTRIDWGKERVKYWDKLNNQSKLMWGWPCPGDKYVAETNKTIVFDNQSNNFDNFILLKVNISQVDQLILNDEFHIRKKWIKKDSWVEERINP